MELIKAFMALIQSAMKLPNWDDVKAIEAWLFGTNAPLAVVLDMMIAQKKVGTYSAVNVEACWDEAVAQLVAEGAINVEKDGKFLEFLKGLLPILLQLLPLFLHLVPPSPPTPPEPAPVV